MPKNTHYDLNCPAATFDEKTDLVMCYGYAYFHYKAGKPEPCNSKNPECDWNKNNIKADDEKS